MDVPDPRTGEMVSEARLLNEMARNAAPPSPPAAAWEGPCVWCTRHESPHHGWCPTLVTDAQWREIDSRRR